MQAIVDDARIKKMIDCDVPNFLSKIERQYNLVELDREEVMGQFMEKFCRYRFDYRRSSLNTFVYMNLRNVVINHVMRRKLDTVSLELVPEAVFRVEPNALDSLLFNDFVGSLSDSPIPYGKPFVFEGRKYCFSLRTVATMLYEGFSIGEIKERFGVNSHRMRPVLRKIRERYQKNI